MSKNYANSVKNTDKQLVDDVACYIVTLPSYASAASDDNIVFAQLPSMIEIASRIGDALAASWFEPIVSFNDYCIDPVYTVQPLTE